MVKFFNAQIRSKNKSVSAKIKPKRLFKRGPAKDLKLVRRNNRLSTKNVSANNTNKFSGQPKEAVAKRALPVP
jgi:hypothetical protein